jgi:hypothetical protein
MITTDFANNYVRYDNFELWEIGSLEDLMKGDELLPRIFKEEYGFAYDERNKPGNVLTDDLATTARKLLAYFGDKHFFIFSNGDDGHRELMDLQDRKIMSFGIDIHVIHPARAYALIMDKSMDLSRYDTL